MNNTEKDPFALYGMFRVQHRICDKLLYKLYINAFYKDN